jgi:hypothetical protein
VAPAIRPIVPPRESDATPASAMASAATTASTTLAARSVVQSRPRARESSASPIASPATRSDAIATHPAKWFLFTNGPKGLTVCTGIDPYSSLPNRARATIA